MKSMPSVIFVLYGIMTQTEIGKLFVAGIVPGLLGVLMYIVTIRCGSVPSSS